jgi:hypothetical protein
MAGPAAGHHGPLGLGQMRIAGRNDKNAQGNVADQAQQAAGAGKKT